MDKDDLEKFVDAAFGGVFPEKRDGQLSQPVKTFLTNGSQWEGRKKTNGP